MIVKFVKPGGSFKGVLQYLTHDLGHAATSERLAWTETRNLAHDHVESAVHEMYCTTLDAELLKAEAGVRASGKPVEKPVKHISLNWHPDEKPDRDEMLRAADAFLKHMGWEEHQAVILAHTDKAHRHVHIVVNAIHPETGCKLDDGFEHRRAQKWALAYEQAQGLIRCEERLKPAAERQASEPRPAWEAIRAAVERDIANGPAAEPYDPSYLARTDMRRVIERREWEILREAQKTDRLAFVAENKKLYRNHYRAAYRDIREAFRSDWAAYYSAKRGGMDTQLLAEIRAGLIARQEVALKERGEEMVAPVREARNAVYRELLDVQKEERRELVERQEQGLVSPWLLDRAYTPQPTPETASPPADTHALDRFGVRRGRHDLEPMDEGRERTGAAPDAYPPSRARHDAGRGMPTPSRDAASGLAGGLLNIIGAIGESMTGASEPEDKSAERKQDALTRFGVRRGLPPPDVGEEEAKRRQREREAWDQWKAKRDLDRSRSGW